MYGRIYVSFRNATLAETIKVTYEIKNVANSLEVERLYVDYLKEEIKLGTNYLS